MCPKDIETHTHVQDTDTASDRRCHRQGAAITSTHTWDPDHTPALTVMSPPSVGLAQTRNSVVQAYTYDTLRVHKHTDTCGSCSVLGGQPFCPLVPLSRSQPSDPLHRSLTQWLVQLSARCKHAALTPHSTGTPQWQVTQHRPPAHLIPPPTWYPRVPCLLAGPA